MADLTLTDAEFELEFDLPNWPTHALDRICGNLVNIGPILLPTAPSRTAYGILWRALDHRDATELLKHLARKELAKRRLEEYEGTCPSCGKGGIIKKFDGGFYYVIRHPNALPGSYLENKLPRLSSYCYHGPYPVPQQRYDERNSEAYRLSIADSPKGNHGVKAGAHIAQPELF